MPATGPGTLAVLQSLQALILANTGTIFAALSSADATRYGVARAVYIGTPKDMKDVYVPACQLIPEAETIVIAGAQARVEDTLTVQLRVLVDFTDWWAAEQSILSIRDTLLPVLVTHLRSGAAAGGALVALSPEHTPERGTFDTVKIADVWYRAWSISLSLLQSYVPASGFSG